MPLPGVGERAVLPASSPGLSPNPVSALGRWPRRIPPCALPVVVFSKERDDGDWEGHAQPCHVRALPSMSVQCLISQSGLCTLTPAALRLHAPIWWLFPAGGPGAGQLLMEA